MIPTERRLVDLGQRQATALVRVFDVGEVIVEVVKRVVPAGSLVGGDDVGHGEAFAELGAGRPEGWKEGQELRRL